MKFKRTPSEDVLTGAVALLKPYCELSETDLVAALQQYESESQHTNPVPTFIDKTEAAERLKLSTFTIIRMCKRGELRACKVGQQWRIDADSLHELTEEGGNSYE